MIVLDAVAQGGIQLPQLISESFPRPLILAEFGISNIGSVKEQLTPLILDRQVEHFLEGRIGLSGHLGETLMCGRADSDSGRHTKLYTILYSLLSTRFPK
jgi:hypothetical protein